MNNLYSLYNLEEIPQIMDWDDSATYSTYEYRAAELCLPYSPYTNYYPTTRNYLVSTGEVPVFVDMFEYPVSPGYWNLFCSPSLQCWPFSSSCPPRHR